MSTDPERTVLGSLLRRNDALTAEVRAILEPGDFVDRRHRLIFAAMLRLDDDGAWVAEDDLAEELGDSPLRSAGGLAFLAGLDADRGAAPDVRVAALRVKQAALRRVAYRSGLEELRELEAVETELAKAERAAEYSRRMLEAGSGPAEWQAYAAGRVNEREGVIDLLVASVVEAEAAGSSTGALLSLLDRLAAESTTPPALSPQ